MEKKSKAAFTAGEVGVILEEIRSQQRAIFEGQDFIKARIEAIETIQARTWEKIAEIDLRLIRVEKKVEELGLRLIRVEKKVEDIDLRLIRMEKNATEVKESVQDHTNRIAHLETLVK